jgi:S1-C subfamily serine protease
MRAGGVVIAEGLVLTAAHAVAGAGEGVEVVVGVGSGATVEGVVVAFDPARDLALVAAHDLSVPPAPTSSIATGDRGFIVVVAPDATVTRVEYTVARRITATGGDIYREGDVERQALELAADVSPGASGAPAFDTEGRVVGIVFAESRARGVTYAVDQSEIDAFLAETDPSRPMAPGRCP